MIESIGIAFVGDFGGGKTSCAVMHSIKYGMLDNERYIAHCQDIDYLKSLGYKVTYSPCLSFGDVNIIYNNKKSLDFQMEYYRMPNEIKDDKENIKYPYKSILRYGVFLFDEAYWKYDARKSFSMDKYTKYALNTRRHNDNILLFTAPRLMQLDKDIRDTLDIVYLMLGVKVKKKLFGGFKTIWKAIKYLDIDYAEKKVLPDSNISVFFAKLQMFNPLLLFTIRGLELRRMYKEVILKSNFVKYVKLKCNYNIFNCYNSKQNRVKYLHLLETYRFNEVYNVLSREIIEQINKEFFSSLKN